MLHTIKKQGKNNKDQSRIILNQVKKYNSMWVPQDVRKPVHADGIMQKLNIELKLDCIIKEATIFLVVKDFGFENKLIDLGNLNLNSKQITRDRTFKWLM